MKIAVLTSGILPIPAVQGGAVENLVDFYLEYNNKYKLHDITVYSVNHPSVHNHKALNSSVNHYYYIDTTSIWARIKRKIFSYKFKGGQHNYFIGYYLNESLKHLLRQHYEMIIMENRPEYALMLQGKINAKFIYHLHNEKLTKHVSKYETIYNLADRIISVSDYITRCVQTINPKDTKCLTVHNGIDLKAFSRVAINSKGLKQRLGFDKDDFILIYSGRINKEKGIIELVKAMYLLNEKKDIKLLIIGGSFFGNNNADNSFIVSLKKLSDPIKERIVFTGFIPYHQIPEYLNIADVAVIPSLWNDPFPTTVLEAQAMGLPIITTNRGGIPEEVSNENAILIDIDNNFVEKLATSIEHLYMNPEIRKRMVEASLKNSLKYNKDTYSEKFFAAIVS